MTGTAIDTATETLLAPTGIEIRDLENVLRTLAGRTVDIADLYFECSRSESWSLEDGIVKEGSYARDQGVGVRAVSGEKTGFAYS
ncbi:MAG: DNA gyrase modulator, partial [Gammaproteobacteria bacterium]|nr:DNA gyrase modulator [Gammaproteobacteria bacterium]